MIHHGRRLLVLQSHFRILHGFAGGFEIPAGGLLRQRLLRQRLDLSASLLELLATLRTINNFFICDPPGSGVS
jgi:hypothetical protein